MDYDTIEAMGRKREEAMIRMTRVAGMAAVLMSAGTAWGQGSVPKTSAEELKQASLRNDAIIAEIKRATGNALDLKNNLWTASKPRARVMLYKMPPTRTVCSFNSIDGQRSVTMEWDPLRPGSLMREVTLVEHKEYRFACQSEPARHALEANVNFAWEYRKICNESGANQDETCDRKGCDPDAKMAIFFADCTAFHLKDTACHVAALGEIAPVELPSINGLEALDGASSGGFRLAVTPPLGALGGPSARAFGDIPEAALNDLFRVIADVAVEKAKSKGMKLLQARVKNLICDDLKEPKIQKQSLLPRTCDAVTQVRMEDLAGGGQQILDAIVRDFVAAAMTELIAQILPEDASKQLKGLKPAFEALSASLDAVVANKPERFQGAAQRVMVAFSRVSWQPTDPGAKKASAAVQLTFAMIAEVNRSGKVDAAAIHEMIESPQLFFRDVPIGDELESLKSFLLLHQELPALVASAARVLSPPADATEMSQLRAAAGIAFDLYAIVEPFLGGMPRDEKSKQLGSTRLRLARDLVDAAVQQDVGRIVTAAAQLLPSAPDGEDKTRKQVTQLAGAIGSYLSTYSSGQKPSAEELKARSEARKAAIGSLIDSQLARSNRLNTWIGSVGGTLGLSGALAWTPTTPEPAVQGQPSLSVGVAIDYHRSDYKGIHFELSPINLGNYLTVRSRTLRADGTEDDQAIVPPSPADAFAPSFTLAGTYLFEQSDLIVLGGFTGGYAFKKGNDAAHNNSAAFFGVVAGVYLPFFDIN